MSTTLFQVTGMTCQHCINAITAEVGSVAHVTGVQVDLDSGHVSVESSEVLDVASVLGAISEAGYSGQLA